MTRISFGMDKLGFTSDVTLGFSGVMKNVQASGINVSWIGHSQGGVIISEAMAFNVRNGITDLSANSITFNAGANNKFITNGIASAVNVSINGYNFSSWDLVPNIVGMNGNPISVLQSIVAAPTLFVGSSPHTIPSDAWSWGPK